jgi:LPXTG-site transpeptidase (sortase) family protein
MRKIKLFIYIFIGIFLVLFFIFNGLAFYSIASYKIKHFYLLLKSEITRPPLFLVETSINTLGQNSMPQLKNLNPSLIPLKESSKNLFLQNHLSLLKKPLDSYKENTLILPQFEIEAPIIKVSNPNLNLIYQQLKKGVVLYPGSADPSKGYSIIIGHSSQYPWEPGRYKSVFSLLNQFQKGDFFYVIWEGKFLIFQVEDKKIFLPFPKGQETTETIFPPEERPILVLQSCWPVGVALKRVAVKAAFVLSN